MLPHNAYILQMCTVCSILLLSFTLLNAVLHPGAQDASEIVQTKCRC